MGVKPSLRNQFLDAIAVRELIQVEAWLVEELATMQEGLDRTRMAHRVTGDQHVAVNVLYYKHARGAIRQLLYRVRKRLDRRLPDWKGTARGAG